MAAGPRVLVVEDDASLRKLLTMRLGIEGFEVTAVEDGQAALDALDSTRPRAVICDLMMPRLDGFGLCRRLRSCAAHDGLPIIVLTARQRDRQIDELLELGGIVFMSKPFDARDLSMTLRELTHTEVASS